MTETADLGIHKGLPITKEAAVITKGARVVSDAMQVALFDVEDGGYAYLSLEVRHAGERFVNVFSKDEPDKLIGYEHQIVLEAIGAAPDDRESTQKAVTKIKAELAERRAAEKGQPPLGDAVSAAEQDGGEGDDGTEIE